LVCVAAAQLSNMIIANAQTRLSTLPTRAPEDLDKTEGKEELESVLEEISALQDILFADGRHAVLLVVQGMDASGKDGVIRDVCRAINPQGLAVTSFKVPSEEEAAHDFLWRIHKAAPARGRIAVFNRSHYEDVLVGRLHRNQSEEWQLSKLKAIEDFERLLAEHNNTMILKCYMHVSAERQRERLEERITDPAKHWKHSPRDAAEAARYAEYLAAYEHIFAQPTAAPWHIIPADQNWYKSLCVARLLRDALQGLGLEYPPRAATA